MVGLQEPVTTLIHLGPAQRSFAITGKPGSLRLLTIYNIVARTQQQFVCNVYTVMNIYTWL